MSPEGAASPSSTGNCPLTCDIPSRMLTTIEYKFG